MTIDNNEKQKRPWYLRKSWVYIMILLLFPVGAVNVLVHRNYWKLEERREYIGILVIFGYLWVLDFLPDRFSWPGISIGLVVLLVMGSLQLGRN
ncbi:hypothetical protein [Lentibacillus cibarius]|uniref:Uncharacterized protein n=1 Tax=Lentibacillus cibarius TaxID=2583219 RepID=A0A5S3QJX8_9BACI|nr:hypothetical protein [Lentibacillus cibarius]TMN22165.1 hypothetical protein FFL34_08520 [Lentibacillus cibarius]